jgi:hypothetical protein
MHVLYQLNFSPSQDPAIISMGAPPNRKNGGYEQGFGFGGGIAVKGPSRVGRQQGYGTSNIVS